MTGATSDVTTPRWVAGNPATTPPQPPLTSLLNFVDEQAKKRAAEKKKHDEDDELERITARYRTKSS